MLNRFSLKLQKELDVYNRNEEVDVLLIKKKRDAGFYSLH